MPSIRTFAAALAAAALLAGAAPARAQTTSPRTMPPPAPPPASPADGDTARPETTNAPQLPPGTPIGGPLLDTPVSRTAYRLGPGDILSVAVFGDFSHVYNVPVTPEGTVVIPEMGIARVLGMNLDQAQERVRQVVARL